MFSKNNKSTKILATKQEIDNLISGQNSKLTKYCSSIFLFFTVCMHATLKPVVIRNGYEITFMGRSYMCFWLAFFTYPKNGFETKRACIPQFHILAFNFKLTLNACQFDYLFKNKVCSCSI